MNEATRVRVLLIEDNPTDALLMREACTDVRGMTFDLVSVETLAAAQRALRGGGGGFDICLLDLGLPDSQGLETFERLRLESDDIPILVLTGLEDEDAGTQAIQQGAQDYLMKREIDAALLGRSVRYAIERTRLQRSLEQIRQRESAQREMESIEQMGDSLPTSVTASLYAGQPLSESRPEEFGKAAEQYAEFVTQALEARIFRIESPVPDRLRALGEHLGFLRSGPRDIVEIHGQALRTLVKDDNPLRTNALIEESRLILLGLMGNLVSYYRHFYSATRREQR